jgi:EpsI family protein
MTLRVLIAIAFLAVDAYTYYFLARSRVIPPRESFASFPNELGDWRCRRRQSVEDDVVANLGVSDYLLCDYGRPDGAVANVYVGYHESQVREEGGGSAENAIHPPAHCLPGSGWDIVDNRTVPIRFAGLPPGGATAKRFVIAKGEARQLVYYWYQSRGRVESEDWQKVLTVGWDRARTGRTDGALVRFTFPMLRRGEDEGDVEAEFADLAPRVVSLLEPYVPN